MITCASHVPRGRLRSTPVRAEISHEDLLKVEAGLQQELQGEDMLEDSEAVAREAASKLGSAGDDLPVVGSSMKMTGLDAGTEQEAEAMLAELDLDNYETESENDNIMERALGPSGLSSGLLFTGEDPYITEKPTHSESEDEDWDYKPEDVVLVATKSKDDMGTLELWVYEQADDTSEGNLFVHHDLVLPSFPLCLALMDFQPDGGSDKATTVAVGSMVPGIEIWDLDVADAVEPICCLVDKVSSKKQEEKKNATVSLAWNTQFRNVLASGGGDKRVRIWDIAKQKRKHTLKVHSKEVQCVAWNPAEASVLATASFDRTSCLVDVRTPDGDPLKWILSGEAEALAWSIDSPTMFFVSSDDGMVICFDARKGSSSDPIFRLSAHEKPATVLSFCPAAPNLLMTASIDKKLKIWNVAGGTPSLITEKDVGAGSIFTGGFCADPVSYLIFVGGDNGDPVVWDTRASPHVNKHFGQAQEIPQVFKEGDAVD